jgi:hypothetical protein
MPEVSAPEEGGRERTAENRHRVGVYEGGLIAVDHPPYEEEAQGELKKELDDAEGGETLAHDAEGAYFDMCP